ncbi:uncharacterized protein C5L36_0A05660 [Pichia kudriavzevii]|uniref:C2H2-type domain-containing protein n=1 Tax=Pichia kudriavzevii TaxID=4909 RepID=A0A099NYB8_PICKU|nr:uncharacterized protein C5L36_0A05660 [Pichia kudriavzevii]AWU73971.1 hypothetical protein C5L36_0A05660 [Pichia kudriavzevii]KGK37818.1 hypothetical protein JL09_g3061 [Pichia kudriavzevii]
MLPPPIHLPMPLVHPLHRYNYYPYTAQSSGLHPLNTSINTYPPRNTQTNVSILATNTSVNINETDTQRQKLPSLSMVLNDIHALPPPPPLPPLNPNISLLTPHASINGPYLSNSRGISVLDGNAIPNKLSTSASVPLSSAHIPVVGDNNYPSLNSTTSKTAATPTTNVITGDNDTTNSTGNTSNTSTATNTKTSNLATGTVRKYICKICDKGFTTSGHLARHHRIHTGAKNHVCPWKDCNARFSRQDNCMQHYKTHLKVKKGRRKYTAKK